MEILFPQQSPNKQHHCIFGISFFHGKLEAAAKVIFLRKRAQILFVNLHSPVSIDPNGLYKKFGPKHIISSSIHRSRAPHFFLSDHNLKNTLRRKSQRKVFFFLYL